MRYVLAIVALAISGVLLLLGVGQRTFLAGPAEIAYSISTDGKTPFAVIDASELAKVEGQANIVLRGDDAFAALANTRDAEAWLEPFDHAVLQINAKKQQLESTTVSGVAPAPDTIPVDDNGDAVIIDPRGSDLWLDERSGSDGVSRMAVVQGDEQSIIVAGADGEPIPKGTAIVWVQDRATPWAGPLLAAGGAFAMLGAVLYLIAFDRDKRALGPRRGRTGPLLGVRNAMGGARRRGKAAPAAEDAPKRGSVDNTPEIAAAEAAAQIGADGADGSVDGVDAEGGAGLTGADKLYADDLDDVDTAEEVEAEMVDDVDHEAEITEIDAEDAEEEVENFEQGDKDAK